MKTNLVDLMSEISQLEKETQELYYILRSENTNVSAIELDGKRQDLETYPEFDIKLNQYMEKLDQLSKLRAIVFEKNNELKLTSGLSIQAALACITTKRKQLNLIQELARQNPSKKRVTEVNNSYFVARELAYDKTFMENTEKEIKQDIKNMEFEISQLNSQTFEI